MNPITLTLIVSSATAITLYLIRIAFYWRRVKHAERLIKDLPITTQWSVKHSVINHLVDSTVIKNK